MAILKRERNVNIDRISVSKSLTQNYDLCYALCDAKTKFEVSMIFVYDTAQGIKTVWYPTYGCKPCDVVTTYHHSKRKATYYVKNILKCYNPKYSVNVFYCA